MGARSQCRSMRAARMRQGLAAASNAAHQNALPAAGPARLMGSTSLAPAGAYMLLVCSLAWRLDASGITIKYW